MTTDKNFSAALMRRAHEITRETVAAFPGADYRATFGAALRELYADARRADDVTAFRDRLTSGDAETGDELQRLLDRAYMAARKNIDVRTENPARVDLLHKHDGDDIRQEIAVRLLDRLTAGRVRTPEGWTLSPDQMAFAAASAAWAGAWRKAYAHPSAAETVTGDDGNEYEIIDLGASVTAARPSAPDAAALMRDEIGAVLEEVAPAYRETAAALIRARVLGVSQKELAAALGVTAAHVSRAASALDAARAIAAEKADAAERLDTELAAIHGTDPIEAACMAYARKKGARYIAPRK